MRIIGLYLKYGINHNINLNKKINKLILLIVRKVTKMKIVNKVNHSLKIQEYINGIKLTMQINKNNQNKHSMVILISIGYFFLLVLHLLVHL